VVSVPCCPKAVLRSIYDADFQPASHRFNESNLLRSQLNMTALHGPKGARAA
jgi:hypothetical protein